MDVGVFLLKAGQNAGQPVVGKAVVGPDGDGALVNATDLGAHLLALLVPVQKLAEEGDHPLAVFGGDHPGPAAHQQGKAQLILQRRNTSADAGRGVPQLLGRPGKTAPIQRA